jgi:hypothetical protein
LCYYTSILETRKVINNRDEFFTVVEIEKSKFEGTTFGKGFLAASFHGGMWKDKRECKLVGGGGKAVNLSFYRNKLCDNGINPFIGAESL